MILNYLFAKNGKLNYYFKENQEDTEYTLTQSDVKFYVCDTVKTIALRNGITTTIEDKSSFMWGNAVCNIYAYKNGAKEELSAPFLTVDSNTYSSYSILVTNPNNKTVSFYSQDLDGTLTIEKDSSQTFSIEWGGETITTHTVTGYFAAQNCKDSAYGSVIVTRPAKPKLTAPDIQEHVNTNYQLGLRYVNQNSIAVTMYINGTAYSIGANEYEDITQKWSAIGSDSFTASAYCVADGYANSDTTSETYSRPEKTKLTAPTLSEFYSCYEYVTIRVTNPNNVKCDVYDNTVKMGSVDANSTFNYNIYWSSSTYNASVLLSADTTQYIESSTTQKTFYRPSLPEIYNDPVITVSTNTTSSVTFNVKNLNSYSVTFSANGLTIGASSTAQVSHSWGSSESTYTLKGYFYKTGYEDSGYGSATATKPTITKLTAPSLSYSTKTVLGTIRYVLTIRNYNSVSCTYTLRGDSQSSGTVSANGTASVYFDYGSSYSVKCYLSASGYLDSSESSITFGS